MNPELEKLLEVTLVDGYLSDKEREVLRKKGESMGLSADEVDIMIDSRLYEVSRANKEKLSKDKCPACGESIKPYHTNCPSCGVELDENRNLSEKKQKKKQKEAKKEDDDFSYYNIMDPIIRDMEDPGKIGSRTNTFFWIYTIITFGVYALVKKITVGGNIFNGNEYRLTMYKVQSDFYEGISKTEPEEPALVSFLIKKREKIIKQQERKNITMSLLSAITILLAIWGSINFVKASHNKSVKRINAEHFKEDDLVSPDGLDEYEREKKIRALLISIDSLKKAGNLQKRDSLILGLNNNKTILWLIDREISDLIEQRKFKEAIDYKIIMEEHSGLLSTYQKDLAEYLIVNDSTIEPQPNNIINKTN